jgi:hypothetical protein
MVEALEGEAATAGALGRGEVEAEEDDVRPGDDVDGEPASLLTAPH